MDFCKLVIILATILAVSISSIANTNADTASIESMDQIPFARHVWNDKKIGRSFEYLFSYRNDTFLEALAYCRNFGFQLLAIDSIEEFEYLNEILMREYYGILCWTSGVDMIPRSTVGQQVWIANGQSILPSMFGPGEPNDLNPGENCVTIVYTFPGYTLNDDSCLAEHDVICKKELPVQ